MCDCVKHYCTTRKHSAKCLRTHVCMCNLPARVFVCACQSVTHTSYSPTWEPSPSKTSMLPPTATPLPQFSDGRDNSRYDFVHNKHVYTLRCIPRFVVHPRFCRQLRFYAISPCKGSVTEEAPATSAYHIFCCVDSWSGKVYIQRGRWGKSE